MPTIGARKLALGPSVGRFVKMGGAAYKVAMDASRHTAMTAETTLARQIDDFIAVLLSS